MRILVGDVGGTKTLLALYEGDDPEALVETRRARFENAGRAGLEGIAAEFAAGALDAASFGVAGPIQGEVCAATNLPWVVDAPALAAHLNVSRVHLLNDFEAIALALDIVPDASLAILQDRPVVPDAPKAVIGAGTGLGQAIVVPTGGALPRVLPTEGGHVDFAPRDDAEIDLLRFLQRRHGRVSIERILSGPGLSAVYDHVLASGEAPSTSATRERIERTDDRAAVIGELGASGDDPAAGIAVGRFVSLYGAAAGNLALSCLPFGGLYLAGGIAPKLLERIRDGAFMSSFRAKGRMERILDRVRVSVITDPSIALLGALRRATAPS